MINYAGMKSEERKGAYGQLPAGPYVGIIRATKIDGDAPDQYLVIRLDVAEGEYKDYFKKRYEHDSSNNSKYEPKYKGDFRLRIPNPNNMKAQRPELGLASFNDALWRIEKSNPGKVLYTENGLDENRLKGLTVGFSMQDDSYNGNPFTRIAKLEVADDVRNGLVKKMEPRKHSGDAYDGFAQTDPQSGFTVVEDPSEIPF